MKNTIDIGAINNAATIIKSEVENLRAQMNKLNDAKEKLNNAWTDTTSKRNAEKVLETLEECQISLSKKIDLFEQLAVKLENNAKRYADVDVKISDNGGAN